VKLTSKGYIEGHPYKWVSRMDKTNSQLHCQLLNMMGSMPLVFCSGSLPVSESQGHERANADKALCS